MPTYMERANDRVQVVIQLAGIARETRIFDTKTQARRWAEAREKELRQHRDLKAKERSALEQDDVTQRTIYQVIQSYLADERVTQLRSFSDTQQRLEWFANKHGTAKIMELGPRRWLEIRAKLNVARGPATVNRYLSCMRACWHWGINQELIPETRKWPKSLALKEPEHRIRFLSDAEFDAVKKAAKGDAVMYAAILASVSTGMRQGELLNLKWADVDLAGGKVTLRKTKNGKTRSVRLLPTAVAALKAMPVRSVTHVFLNTDGKPLKKSLLETRWYKIRTAAKLVDFHWHDFRHTAASIRIQSGATLYEVGELLGHSSPTMTAKYAHLLPNQVLKGDAELDKKLSE